MAEIITPGHGLVTDTLIMHAIARLYDVSEVERAGDRYRITGNFTKIRKDVISLVRDELAMYFNAKYIGKETEIFETSAVLGKLLNANVNIAYTPKWLAELEDSIDHADLTDITEVYTENHKVDKKEGLQVSKRSAYHTLYTVLSYRNNIRIEGIAGEKSYQVCDHCFVLANIGLIYGAAVFRYNYENRSVATMLSIIPADRMGREDLLLAQRFLRGRALMLKADLSMKAAALYAFSVGEVLFTSNANPMALVWRAEKTGGELMPITAITFPLNGFLRKLAKIKLQYPEYVDLVKDLAATNEGASVLDTLADTLLTGSDPASVIGKITALAEKGLIPQSISSSLETFAEVLGE